MDSSNSSTPICPEPTETVSVRNGCETDENWDRDPDWNSSRLNMSNTTLLLPTSKPPNLRATSNTTTSSTSTGTTVFITEAGTTQPGQPAAHQFVVPDVTGHSLGIPGSDKVKPTIKEVRLILNDGSTKRFIEVDGARDKGVDNPNSTKTLISGACQTGESIINGEPALRIPVDLNLPPVGVFEISVGGSRKRPHEDSSRDVRSCGSQPQYTTSTRSEDYAPKFSTPKNLIDLMTYCVECRIKFQSRREAVDHQKYKHSKKFCPYCYYLFTTKGSTLKEHFTACHVTNTDKEMSPCFFCAKNKSGSTKEFNFDGLYQHMSKAHLLPLEVLARENNGRLSPDLPSLTPDISLTNSSYRPPPSPVVYLPSSNDLGEASQNLTLDEIIDYGSNNNGRRMENPVSTINQIPPTGTTARNDVPTTPNRGSELTTEPKDFGQRTEVRQSSSSTIRTTGENTEHTAHSEDNSKVNPPQIPQSNIQPQKSNNSVVNTGSSAASNNNAEVSSPKTNVESSLPSTNTTSVQISKNKTSSPEASSSSRNSSSLAKVNGVSSEYSNRLQTQTPGTTSASGTSNQTTRQSDAPEDRTHSRTASSHEGELSREVKDSIKRWWKTAENDNRFPNYPNCQHIALLAARHEVTFELVKCWFLRHTEKKRQKLLAKSS